MGDSLGDRMKANYEDRARHYLTRRTPVVIRLDGKAFHSFTRGLERPYDRILWSCMATAALSVAEEMQGFKVGYVQSDEASFVLTDYDRLESGAWFDSNKSKIETIAASAMTAFFNAEARKKLPDDVGLAMFDGRAFNVPREEVANYLLWRAIDWRRNSVAMLAQAHFSPKELHGKGKADQLVMLMSKGIDWSKEAEPIFQNGTFLLREESGISIAEDVPPSFAAIDALVAPRIAAVES